MSLDNIMAQYSHKIQP